MASRPRKPIVAIPDANKIAASLITPNGFVAKELARADIRFVAPEFLLDELHDHEAEFAERADVSRQTIRDRIARVEEHVELARTSDLVPFAAHELVLACDKVDRDDSPYFAAYVAGDADQVWTSDKALRDAFPDIAKAILPRRVA